MSELRSKCCGAKVYSYTHPISVYGSIEQEWRCSKCHKPTEVEKKEE